MFQEAAKISCRESEELQLLLVLFCTFIPHLIYGDPLLEIEPSRDSLELRLRLFKHVYLGGKKSFWDQK